MYKQYNSNFLPIIQKVGCFFLSCVNLVELKTGVKLSINQINDLWNFCKETKIIDENNNIVSSAKIMNQILKNSGLKIRCYEVATKQDNKINYYPSVSENFRNNENKGFIQKIKTSGVYGTHFRIVNNSDMVIYDSVDVENYQKIFYTIVYVFC